MCLTGDCCVNVSSFQSFDPEVICTECVLATVSSSAKFKHNFSLKSLKIVNKVVFLESHKMVKFSDNGYLLISFLSYFFLHLLTKQFEKDLLSSDTSTS